VLAGNIGDRRGTVKNERVVDRRSGYADVELHRADGRDLHGLDRAEGSQYTRPGAERNERVSVLHASGEARDEREVVRIGAELPRMSGGPGGEIELELECAGESARVIAVVEEEYARAPSHRRQLGYRVLKPEDSRAGGVHVRIDAAQAPLDVRKVG